MEDISLHVKVALELESAIKNKNRINFTYKIGKNSFIVQTNPLKIVNDQGFWYLLSYDTEQNTLKNII